MEVRIWRLMGAFALLTWVTATSGCSGGAQPTVVAAGSSTSQQIPFGENKPLVVPADTIVYVRLQHPLSSSSAAAGQNFSALLDEALLADDQTVAAVGTEVTGTVVAARASGRVNTAGYVRVVLSSINVNGKSVPLQTASVIAGGANIRNHNLSVIGNSFQESNHKSQAGFAAGQRVGFRLTQPVSF